MAKRVSIEELVAVIQENGVKRKRMRDMLARIFETITKEPMPLCEKVCRRCDGKLLASKGND